MSQFQIEIRVDFRVRSNQHNLAYSFRTLLFMIFVNAYHHVLEDSGSEIEDIGIVVDGL